MLRFSAPLWLAAGALLTIVPIVLHLIAPRPPARAPLPTARFLEPEARARRHLSRRPRDRALLLLRCAFLLLLGAAMARPRIAPPRAGTGEIVLADTALVSEARARFGDDATYITVDTGGYAAALRALPRTAVRRTRADSVHVTSFIPSHWHSWTPGTSTLRATWPSSLSPHLPESVAVSVAVAVAPADPIQIIAPAPAHEDLNAALIALGRDDTAIIADTVPGDAPTGIVIIAGDTTGTPRTLITAGEVLPGIAGNAVALPRGAHTIAAAWADGSAAAIVERDGELCRITTGIVLAHPALRASPSLPGVLGALITACDDAPGPAGGLPLDSAAVAMLAGAGAPPIAAIEEIPGADAYGRPLARWLIIAALLVAIAETVVAARRDRGTTASPPGTSPA